MQAVTEERLSTVAVMHVTDDTTKIEFVHKLLSESKKLELKKSIILMDSELGRWRIRINED